MLGFMPNSRRGFMPGFMRDFKLGKVLRLSEPGAWHKPASRAVWSCATVRGSVDNFIADSVFRVKFLQISRKEGSEQWRHVK